MIILIYNSSSLDKSSTLSLALSHFPLAPEQRQLTTQGTEAFEHGHAFRHLDRLHLHDSAFIDS